MFMSILLGERTNAQYWIWYQAAGPFEVCDTNCSVHAFYIDTARREMSNTAK
jgi:hypothetical protein